MLEAPEEKIKQLVSEKLAKLIIANRQGKIKVKPGYDGVYGEALIDGEEIPKKQYKAKIKQKNLLEF